MKIRFTTVRSLLLWLLILCSWNTHAQIFWEENFNDTISVLPEDWQAFDNNAGGGVWEITNVGPIGP
ncbi:MAG: hypothetical protein AB8F74_02350, partial [Saprospiraceae bacterium]